MCTLFVIKVVDLLADVEMGGLRAVAYDPRTDVAMPCPRCTFRTMVAIDVIVSGEPMIMRSCSACNERWWEGPSGRVPLALVLDQVGGAVRSG